MTDPSRRGFLRCASAGAAVIGVAAAVPLALAASADAQPEAAEPSTRGHSGPFLAWVDDLASGDVTVLVDERQIVHHDPALARRLAALAARALS